MCNIKNMKPYVISHVAYQKILDSIIKNDGIDSRDVRKYLYENYVCWIDDEWTPVYINFKDEESKILFLLKFAQDA